MLRFIIALAQERARDMDVFGGAVPDITKEKVEASQAFSMACLLEDASTGVLEWTRDRANAVVDAHDSFKSLLFQVPGVRGASIPTEFYGTAFGLVMVKALVWATQDQFLSYAEAAEITGRSAHNLRMAVSVGRLISIPDYFGKNRPAVLKSQVVDKK